MITQGPFSLTLNQTLPLDDPGATSNNPAQTVQLQNASPFIIDVNAGGQFFTIQSFTAQTIPTSGGGQQMSVTPIESNSTGVTTSANSLTVVWLLEGENPPMLDGSLTAAAIATLLGTISVQGGVDFLGSGAMAASTSEGIPNGGPVPAKHAYTALIVIANGADTANLAYAVAENQSLAASGNTAQWGAPFSTQVAGGGRGGIYQSIIPISCNVGDEILATVYCIASSTIGHIFLFGSWGEPGLPIRPDGRTYPIGLFASASAATSGALIAAPASPLRILLHSGFVACVGGGAGTFVALNATVNGQTPDIALCPTDSNLALTLPPQGLLLDVGTALTIQSTGGPTLAYTYAAFDLVV